MASTTHSSNKLRFRVYGTYHGSRNAPTVRALTPRLAVAEYVGLRFRPHLTIEEMPRSTVDRRTRRYMVDGDKIAVVPID